MPLTSASTGQDTDEANKHVLLYLPSLAFAAKSEKRWCKRGAHGHSHRGFLQTRFAKKLDANTVAVTCRKYQLMSALF
jgi:hypothetical protein